MESEEMAVVVLEVVQQHSSTAGVQTGPNWLRVLCHCWREAPSGSKNGISQSIWVRCRSCCFNEVSDFLTNLTKLLQILEIRILRSMTDECCRNDAYNTIESSTATFSIHPQVEWKETCVKLWKWVGTQSSRTN